MITQRDSYGGSTALHYCRNTMYKASNGMFARINGQIEILMDHKFQIVRSTSTGIIAPNNQSAMTMANKKESIHNNMTMNASQSRANVRNDTSSMPRGVNGQDRFKQTQSVNQFRPQFLRDEQQRNVMVSDETNPMAGFIRTPHGWYRDMTAVHHNHHPNGNASEAARVTGLSHFYGGNQYPNFQNNSGTRSMQYLPPSLLPSQPPVDSSTHPHKRAPVIVKAQTPRRNSAGSAATELSVPGPNTGNHNKERISKPPRKMFFYRHANPQSSNAGNSISSISELAMTERRVPLNSHHRNPPQPVLAQPVPRYVPGYSANSEHSPQALNDITNQGSGVNGNDISKSYPQLHVDTRNSGDRQVQVDMNVNNHSDSNQCSISNDNRYANSLGYNPAASISDATAKKISPSSSASTSNTAKRSADDLHSLCSTSSWSSSAIVTTDASEQKFKRQRGTSHEGSDASFLSRTSASVAAKIPSPSACPRGMLDLLCEASAIVSKRKEVESRKPVSSVQTDQKHPRQVFNVGKNKKETQARNDSTNIPRREPSIGIVSRSPTPILPIPNIVLDKPRSCNCPRSRCIKLYCECFQSGKFCSAKCQCKECQNTEEHDAPGGVRTRAIQNILSRNPHAFQKDKQFEKMKADSVGVNCRCVKSQCLKLYCDCFQSGKVCGEYCMCVNCLNTTKESGPDGRRTIARSICLLRKPEAFKKKVKVVGGGCSCKNSKCLKKYCACFDAGLACSPKCSCKDCQNMTPQDLKAKRALSQPNHKNSFKLNLTN